MGQKLTEVADGVGEEVLSEADGNVVTGGEDLGLVLVNVVFLIVLVLLDSLTGLAAGALLLLNLGSLLALLLSDVTSTETEPAKEADTLNASLIELSLELGLGLGVSIGALASLLLLPNGVDEVEHAAGQVLALLPVNLDWIRDVASPAVLAVAPPELLGERLVGEELVLLEVKGDGDAAGVAIGELEALNINVLEGLDEDLSVAGVDVFVNLSRSLLESEGPEVGDLGNSLLTLYEEVLCDLVLVTDCMRGMLVLASQGVNGTLWGNCPSIREQTYGAQPRRPQSHPQGC